MKKLSTIWFFLLLIVLIFPFNKALAVETNQMGILPAHPDPNVKWSDVWFVYTLKPGESKSDEVRVINNTDEVLKAKVYPVDATTTPDGAFALFGEKDEQKEIGKWVKLAKYEVEIPPKTTEIIPFTLTLPMENLDVGEHIGGIVLEKGQPESQKIKGTTLNIITRVGVRMYITIPGKIIKDLKITNLEWSLTSRFHTLKEVIWLDRLWDFLGFNKDVNFRIYFENKGNVHLDPTGNFYIKNILGRTKEIRVDNLGTVFPKKTSSAPFKWEKAPFFGRFALKADVTYDKEKPQATYKMVFWLIPYRLLFVLSVLLGLIIIIRLTMLLILAKAKKKMVVYRVEPSDSLATIAEKYNLSWRKIAKINKLKPPYHLKEGQEIYLPIKKKKEK